MPSSKSAEGARKGAAGAELPILQKTYDLLRWLIPHLNKMPRNQKFLLGDRMENALLDLLGLLIEASMEKRKLPFLRKASAELEKFRFLVRLFGDLHVLGSRRHAYLAERLGEIGRMLGGWIKEREERERARETP